MGIVIVGTHHVSSHTQKKKKEKKKGRKKKKKIKEKRKKKKRSIPIQDQCISFFGRLSGALKKYCKLASGYQIRKTIYLYGSKNTMGCSVELCQNTRVLECICDLS